jgi:predicted TPR repeat methyltransferase
MAQHRASDLEGAAVAYQRILARDPHNVDALHFFGLLEHQRGRSELGLELMNRAIARCPDHADFLSNRGNVLKLLGRLELAEQDFRHVLSLDPNHTNALNNLGTVLRERGEFEEAVELYRKAIALDPSHADAYRNLGNALGSLNRFEEALDAHREALRLRPNRGDSYRHLAGMYYALGRIDAAADLYRQWLALEPGHPVPTHMLAACTGVDVPARASNDYVRASFDQFAASFDRALLRLEYRAPQLVGEALSDIMGPEAMQLDILDAGCGTGLLADVIRPVARRLVGVDLSPQMIERARSRNSYDELHVSELGEFCRSRPRQYDAIVSADTLVYFGALEEVLDAMARALRLSGHLVFTVEQLAQTTGAGGFRIQPHGRYQHSAGYLEHTLGQAGFLAVHLQSVQLRKEAGKWVDGLLVAAHLPSVTGSDNT